MSTTSAIPAFLDALADALANRADLVGVTIWSAPVAPETAGKESIQLFDVEETQLGQVGNTGRQEDFTVHGQIEIVWPTPPLQVEPSIRAARARAFAILAAVEDQLRGDTKASQTVRLAQFAALHCKQGWAGDGGRAVQLAFDLSIRTWLPTQ